jgi:hypothetical protein
MENTISPPIDFKSLLIYQNITFKAFYEAVIIDDDYQRLDSFQHKTTFMDLVRTTLNFHIELFWEYFQDLKMCDNVIPRTSIKDIFEMKVGLIYSLIDFIEYNHVTTNEVYKALKEQFDLLQAIETRIYEANQ